MENTTEVEAAPTWGPSRPDPTVGVLEIVAELRRAWLSYGVIVAVFVCIGVAAALLWPKSYRSEIVLLPVSAKGPAGGLAALAGQFGGLASLAGVSLFDGDTETKAAVAMLKSRELIYRFVERNQLLPTLFWKKWDSTRKTWNVDDPDDIPTVWDAYRLIDRHVRSVEEDRRTGLITLSIEWRDREQAARWVSDLVSLADDALRAQAISESEGRIRLLEAELARNPALEVRSGIFRMIETEIQRATVARASQLYAFRVVDPPVVPDSNVYVRPKPFIYLALASLAGIGLCLLVAVARCVRNVSTRP